MSADALIMLRRNVKHTLRNPFIFRAHAAKKNGASVTGTEEFPVSRFNQMGMANGDFRTAEFTTFHVFLTPDELAEGSECVLKSRLYCIHY